MSLETVPVPKNPDFRGDDLRMQLDLVRELSRSQQSEWIGKYAAIFRGIANARPDLVIEFELESLPRMQKILDRAHGDIFDGDDSAQDTSRDIDWKAEAWARDNL